MATVARKICVVTGSRAEYGLLYWLLKEIQDDSRLKLQLVVTGTHLSPEFGLTVQQIEADGFVPDARVDMLVSSDTPAGIAKSIGLGVIGFADAFAFASMHPNPCAIHQGAVEHGPAAISLPHSQNVEVVLNEPLVDSI